MDVGPGTSPKKCLNAFQSKRLWKILGLNGIRCITSTEMLLGQYLQSRRHDGNSLDVSKRRGEAKERINNNLKKPQQDHSVNRFPFLSIDYYFCNRENKHIAFKNSKAMWSLE